MLRKSDNTIANTQDNQQELSLLALPPDVIHLILKFLDASDVKKFAFSCKLSLQRSQPRLREFLVQRTPKRLLLPLAVKHQLPTDATQEDYIRALARDESDNKNLQEAHSLHLQQANLQQEIQENSSSICFATGLTANKFTIIHPTLIIAVFLFMLGCMQAIGGDYRTAAKVIPASALILLIPFVALLGNMRGMCELEKLSELRSTLESKLRFNLFTAADSTTASAEVTPPSHSIQQDDDDLEIGFFNKKITSYNTF